MSSLIAGYLFLGGTGAGLFFVAVLTQLFHRAPLDGVAVWQRALVLSAAMLALGCVCLFLDLGRPQAILNLFFTKSVTFISVGAWALALLILCQIVLLVVVPWQGRRHTCGVRIGFALLGGILSLYVMVYTGFLLRQSVGVDLWQADMLPVLFFCSSLAAGSAAFSYCVKCFDLGILLRRKAIRSLATGEMVLLIIETVVAVLFLGEIYGNAYGAQALSVLWQPQNLAWFFGGYCGLGLLVPFAADLVALRGKSGDLPILIGATAALFGAFCLRYALVQAGINVLF